MQEMDGNSTGASQNNPLAPDTRSGTGRETGWAWMLLGPPGRAVCVLSPALFALVCNLLRLTRLGKCLADAGDICVTYGGGGRKRHNYKLLGAQPAS